MFNAVVDGVSQIISWAFVGEPESPVEPTGTSRHDHQPTPTEIGLVRSMMCRACRLPPDIVDAVFDHAGYWARSRNRIDFEEEHRDPLRIVGGSREENKFLLRSFPVGLTHLDDRKDLAEVLAYDLNRLQPLPLEREHDAKFFKGLVSYPTPRLVHPVRKVVFTIKSHDQGWANRNVQRGSYKASWTWFEAGLERFDADATCEPDCTSDLRYNSPKSPAPALPLCALRPVEPPIEPVAGEDDAPSHQYVHPLYARPDREIQRNKVATKDWQEHTVTWSWDDDVDPESDEARRLDEEQGRGPGTASGEFVRGLKLGDVISVWGSVRFRAWTNIIEKVQVDVYWAV